MTTGHLGQEFFAGVLGWSFDKVASKLVAYVTAGYPPEARASFAAAAHAGMAREFINGVAVVRCEGAGVATTTARLLDGTWRGRQGVVDSVAAFFREATAAVRASQAAASAGQRAPPPG